MMRHYQWSVAEVSAVIGVTTLSSVPQMMLIGWFVERRFQRGQTDIHLTSYAVIVLLSAVLIIAAVAVQIAWLAAVLFAIGLGILAYIGVASAAMQLVTPNEFRGQVSVTFMFIMTLIGYGIGPSLPAAFTDFLFHDDKMVGWSMALSLAVTAPVAAAFLWYGRGAMRRAVEDAKAWTGS
jgi:MFS family permease